MPEATMTRVELTCLQGLADLERLEGPWLDGLATGDPEVAATTVRLLLAHMTWNSKRLLGVMVLDLMDAESLSKDWIQPLDATTTKNNWAGTI